MALIDGRCALRISLASCCLARCREAAAPRAKRAARLLPPHRGYPTCCPLIRFSHIGSIKDAACMVTQVARRCLAHCRFAAGAGQTTFGKPDPREARSLPLVLRFSPIVSLEVEHRTVDLRRISFVKPNQLSSHGGIQQQAAF